MALQQMPAYAQVDARQEAARQATRQISESITRRITEAALPGAEVKELEELANGWISPSYTNINFNDFDADIDIYQVVGGADKRLGSFYAGASAGYARAEAEAFGFDFGAHSPSFSPYAAYIVNDNVLVTGIVGYSRTEIDDNEIATDSAFTDLSLTGLLPVNHLIVTGKFGHRFAYTDLEDAPSFVDDDSFVNTLYLMGEAGYRIDRWLPYFRATYEHLIPEEGEDSELVFIGVGTSYDFSDIFSAGLSYQTELNHLDDFNYNQAVLDIRFRF